MLRHSDVLNGNQIERRNRPMWKVSFNAYELFGGKLQMIWTNGKLKPSMKLVMSKHRSNVLNTNWTVNRWVLMDFQLSFFDAIPFFHLHSSVKIQQVKRSQIFNYDSGNAWNAPFGDIRWIFHKMMKLTRFINKTYKMIFGLSKYRSLSAYSTRNIMQIWKSNFQFILSRFE